MSNSYYSGVNPDLLARIPVTANRILEVGCGEGNFGRAYLARNPSAQYVGVELFKEAAYKAATYLSHVIVGDIEQPRTLVALDKVCGNGSIDTLILGDVLEHLRDPWRVLAELRDRMAPGCTCIACIPNVCHWSILQQQLNGESIAKSFHATLGHLEYLTVLRTCDIALLPLADTEFNRLKSDLKLIECAACSVVAICSPTVYADNPDHAQLAIIASSPEDWRNAILRLCADSLLRQTLRNQGYAYVKAKRMHAYQARERQQYYSWLMAELPALEKSRQQRMQSLRWRPASVR